jgi:hypothetical protein
MSKPVDMPKGFAEAFKLVCDYYGCTSDEIEGLREKVREDPENAAKCYFELQRLILGDAIGINERIREEIQAKQQAEAK